jgi:hypothetical protein
MRGRGIIWFVPAVLAAVAFALAGCGRDGTATGPQGTGGAAVSYGNRCYKSGSAPVITWTSVAARHAGRPAPVQDSSGGGDASVDPFAALDARSVDPAPVTAAEAFDKRIVNPIPVTCGWPGVRYATLAYAHDSTDCAAAVWGAALKSALRQAACTQVLRGAYLSNSGGLVGLVALVNLRDSSGATQVSDLLAPMATGSGATLPRSGFLLPTGRPASMSRLGEGYSEAMVDPLGHYILVGWVARADGARPSDPFWNLGQMLSLMMTPSAGLKHRIPVTPPVTIRIYANHGHPIRCVVPATVPRYSKVNVDLYGNTRVSYMIPLFPGATLGSSDTVALGGLFTSAVDNNVMTLKTPGVYAITITPAPARSCVLTVR